MKQFHVIFFNKLLLLIAFVVCTSISYAQFAGGTGTEADPYQVQTAEHLNNVRSYLSSSFLQIADIDLNTGPYNQGQGWVPIGNDDSSTGNIAFTGSFIGNGYVISGLYINRSTSNNQGLFGFSRNASFTKIRLTGVNVSGLNNVGGLIGNAYYGDNIFSDCSVTGNVTGSNSYVGGLIGKCASSTVSSCVTHADVLGGNTSTGGLVGYVVSTSTFSKCYSTGSIQGQTEVGGLIGHIDYTQLYDCYATGDVTGVNIVGGLLGVHCEGSSVSGCYSTGVITGTTSFVGGLAGKRQNFQDAVNSYWDMESSGQITSYSGAGRATDEMTYPYAANTYVSWDFNTVWAADSSGTVNDGYPYLQNLPYQVPVSFFSPLPGNYFQPINLAIQNAISDTDIYYTLDGTEPNEQSLVYTNPIPVNGNITIRTRAYKEGWYPSDILTGRYTISVNSEDEVAYPDNVILYPAHPNPFRQNTFIRFNLIKESDVSLIIYNLKGQQIRTLAFGNFKKGDQSFQWDGIDNDGKAVPSGMYLYKLKGAEFEISRKLTLMK